MFTRVEWPVDAANIPQDSTVVICHCYLYISTYSVIHLDEFCLFGATGLCNSGTPVFRIYGLLKKTCDRSYRSRVRSLYRGQHKQKAADKSLSTVWWSDPWC